MNLVQRVYDEFAHLVHEIAKFGVVGALAFVVNFVVSNAIWVWQGDQWTLTSKVIGTVAATIFAFLGNRYWTFRHREKSGLAREYFLFFVMNGVAMLFELLFVGFARYTLGTASLIALNIAWGFGIVCGTMFRFWSYKKWVFLPPELPPVDPHTGLPEPAPELVAEAEDVLRNARPFTPAPISSVNGHAPVHKRQT